MKLKFEMSEQNEETTPLVAAVQPKLPDFWSQAADVWLAQVEAQFRISRITSSQSKFDLCVQK